MTPINQRIQQARHGASLTQKGLAERVDVNRSAVAQWERQGGARPSSENLAKIAVITKVNFDWLATGRGSPSLAKRTTPKTKAPTMPTVARTALEKRLLLGFRTMSLSKQTALVTLLDATSKQVPTKPKHR